MTTTIKIFGERNTSTNALKALIEINSTSKVAPSVAKELDPNVTHRLRLARMLLIPAVWREHMIDSVFEGRPPLRAWKHAATLFNEMQCFEGCHVIFCVRHPMSWLLGLFKRPYHIHGKASESFYDFLDKRWKTVGREGLGRAETSPIELYNIKMASYAKLQCRLQEMGHTYSVVRHEDFAVDQEQVFLNLAPHLDGPHTEFQTLDASTKDSKKTRSYYQDYYGEERWRDEIDVRSNSRIVENIDWSALEGLRYFPD